MLRSLYIKNYALIEEFTVTFDRGLNIITGETGAGKSIVLGAFSLLIGERASSDVIRTGGDKAIVEAEFDTKGNPKLDKFLREHELDVEGETLIVRREVRASGSGRAYVNDSPVTAQLLKELGAYLVDLHGQHEHQSLLRTEAHVVMLDDFGGLEPEVERFEKLRHAFIALLAEIDDIKSREQRLREERDLYEFQLSEIAAVNPEPNEDATIERELSVLENAEELRDTASLVHETLYEEEGSVYEKLSKSRQQLERLAKLDVSLKDQLQELQSALAITSELSKFLSRYSQRVELQPERLNELRVRAQSIARLKKKYGGSMEALIAKRTELEEKLTLSENFDVTIAEKERELKRLQKQASEAARALSTKRKSVAQKLEPSIVEVLRELGIEHGQFIVRFVQRELAESERNRAAVLREDGTSIYSNARGSDLVEFFISTNAGEDPKPLVKVASGGEISRIMLSLKTILAKTDRMPLLVFDEIDVGISGRIAQRVGRAMKLLGAEHQIIAISHLAQIAAFADAHYLVQKSSSKNQTTSVLRKLSDAEHVEEVARLISGSELSNSSMLAAEELIREAALASIPKSNGVGKRTKSSV